MKEVVIVSCGRSAIGKFGGVTASTPAKTLGAAVIKSIVAKSKIDVKDIDEVIMGQALMGGCGQNPARQAAIEAGILEKTPAYTINKVCGSGLKAISLACQSIICDDADIIVAGGQESMDMAPHVLHNSRKGQRLGEWVMEDSVIKDGLLDVFNNYLMGVTAENIAEKYKISKEEQDEFAYKSQMKTKKAMEGGRFKEEIIPVTISQGKKGSIIFKEDEHPRFDTTMEGLAKLIPSFKKGGTVTAGNATSINNGAAALLLMSREKALSLGLQPLAKIIGFASVGLDPKVMGLGPIMAVEKCLKKANWQLSDVGLWEINEAFAVQVIAAIKELKLNSEIINVNGGAIALGHPIGASGARIVVTLLHEMIKRDIKKGVATLCVGGGMGVAMAIER
jgi:acetyl-CoA C-acetyltransferase